MRTHNTDVLIQGLFNCGSYEKGQAFIKDHAGEITREFVSAVRAASMNLLTGEKAAPDLAPVFAELAFVAAIVLGDDDEKGMSRYCEGSILARLGNYREAILRFEEAEAYLAMGTNSQQLANCLYDHAICHHKLGELPQALRLLGEALPYQNTEKERGDTLAFMLVLERQSGNIVDSEDINDFMRRASRPPGSRRVQLRETTDLQEKRRICDSLASHHPLLKDQELFRNSIPHFLASSHYCFFAAADTAQPSDQWPPVAYGLAKRYRDNLNDIDLLGLEAVCFADSDSQRHLEIIEGLKSMAQDRDIWAVCISEKSFSHIGSFRALLRGIGIESLPSVLMQGAEQGIYSAFTESPDTSAFFARCIAIPARKEQWDFNGELAVGTTPLYRGEGRLKHQSKRECWDFHKLEELCEYFFSNGFRARLSGRFKGTVQAQLLHQGYVEQPTVSLSESPDVCAYYATDKHTREGGIVFKVDTAALLQRSRVYDSLATLKKTCPWILGGFYDQIVRIMSALDGGSGDVRESGVFLEQCHGESRRRVASFGGGQTFGPEMDWPGFLGGDVFTRLETHGISKGELDAMNEEFELFWSIALGKMTGMDKIDADSGLSESIHLSRAYFKGFDEVRLKLKEQWILNQFSRYNHPGWDLSPFGYITKTIRDKEFFSGGDVPGDCIIEATIVDRMGVQEKVIRNQDAAGA